MPRAVTGRRLPRDFGGNDNYAYAARHDDDHRRHLAGPVNAGRYEPSSRPARAESVPGSSHQSAPRHGRPTSPRRGRAGLHLVRMDDPSVESLDTTHRERTQEGDGPPSPGPWPMWASIERRTRPADAHPAETVYCSLGTDIDYPRRRGHVVLMPVLVTEKPGGPYWGWLADDAAAPTLIQRQNPASDRTLPATRAAEQRARHGRMVRLAIEPLTVED
jgi:hypothetical protein